MLNMSCKLFSSIPVEKKTTNRADRMAKKTVNIELKYILQFPAEPAHFLGLTEKTTFAHLTQNIQQFKGCFFFVISSNLVIASEWTTSRNQYALLSMDL